MDEKNEGFTYAYSAEQQKELREIRARYAPEIPETSKIEELRRLDKRVRQAGTLPAVTLGTISALVMGVGMSCAMVWKGIWFLPGIVIGAVGIIGVLLAYPLHNVLVKKRRKQLAPQILKLTDELME